MKNKRWICHGLEIARWICVIIGFQCAFLLGNNPVEQFHVLTVWIVVGLAGLTGIESIFFGKIASSVSGYTPSAYQRQSGMNNLALAILGDGSPYLLTLLVESEWGGSAEARYTVVKLTLQVSIFPACDQRIECNYEAHQCRFMVVSG